MKRQILTTIGCVVASVATARQQTIPLLPPPTHADTEVTTNLPCAFDHPAMKEVNFTVAADGTTSNNVEVNVGTDRDGDGELSFDEGEFTVEWVCGEWFVRGAGSGIGDWGLGIGNGETGTVSFVTYGPDTNGFVTAVLTIPIRRQKSNLGWLFSPTWNMVRVTKRGIDEPMERVTLGTRVSGTLLLVR